VTTMSFDWGSIKWFVTPYAIQGASSSLGEVIVNPGKGHARHNHPGAEEVIYVISGEGKQMVDDGEPFAIKEGDSVYIPKGDEPQRLSPVVTHHVEEQPSRDRNRAGDCNARRVGEGG